MTPSYHARCECGQLQITVTQEPYAIVQCHCQACQRRTGAPYGIGVYCHKDSCQIGGDSKSYIRQGSSGSDFENRFCPTCATTVYWLTPFHPEGVGIAYGCFEGDDLPAPDRSVWESERHHWVEYKAKGRWLEGRTGPRVD